ncbi:MAG: HEAT repeat domain-containing protein, partial [Myxococcota bacterium]|nr:HEAT repeat domain-containing protein [Myxococcota bacterium]
KLKDSTFSDGESTIRSKCMRGLYRLAQSRSEAEVIAFLKDCQDSVFNDVRVLSVVRLQERIQEALAATPQWSSDVMSAEDWQARLAVDSSLDPSISLVGTPQMLAEELTLINRIFFWHGHESVHEAIKIYRAHNLMKGDAIETQRFLLQIPNATIFETISKDVCNNIQDAMIKGQGEPWFWNLTEELLNLYNADWSMRFYKKASAVFAKPKSEEEIALVSEGKPLPPNIRFVKQALLSRHGDIQYASLNSILRHFDAPWLIPIMLEFLLNDVPRLRKLPLGRAGIEIFEKNQALTKACHTLLQHTEVEMVKEGLQIMRSHPKIIDVDLIDRLLDLMAAVHDPNKPSIDKTFVREELIDPKLFRAIPQPDMFGQNQEKPYFEGLKDLFLYQTRSDVQDEIDAYQERRAALQSLIEEFEKPESEEQEETLRQARADYEALEAEGEPAPYQDSAFLDVIDLIGHAQGQWVKGILDEYISSDDEPLANRAFAAAFQLAARAGESEQYIMSILKDNHPRLDDLFTMVLQNAEDWRANVLQRFTQLKRIDIVFRSFEELTKYPDLFDTDTWEGLLSSRYDFLRYSAFHNLFTGKKEQVRSYLRKHYMTLLADSKPVPKYKDLSVEQLTEKIEQSDAGIDPDEMVHVFLKDVGHAPKEVLLHLQAKFDVSTSRFRYLRGHTPSCIVSDIKLADAVSIKQELEKLGAVIWISDKDLNYLQKTISLWRKVMSAVLRFVQEDNLLSNKEIFSLLRIFEESCRDDQWDESDLRLSSVQAMGSVADREDCAHLTMLLADSNETIVAAAAKSLVRSGHERGLQHLFDREDTRRKDIISAMICCSEHAENILLRIIGGSKDKELLRELFLIWLLQRSQIGGSMEYMTSVLSCENQEAVLIAAQTLGSLYDQQTFFDTIYALFQLRGVKLKRPVDTFKFHKTADWILMMQRVKKEYEQHYLAQLKKESQAEQRMPKASWRWLAEALASQNTRVRFAVAGLVLKASGGYLNKEIETWKERLTYHDISPVPFSPFVLNGKVVDQKAAIQYSFGALIGLVRSPGSYTLSTRRKALSAAIELGRNHTLPSISAFLSVAFNDSSDALREDAMTLALSYQKELGLSQDQILRLALNGVAWRNPKTKGGRYDTLNQMIISELHIQNQHAKLLDFVRNENHYIAEISLDLLLDYQDKETREPTYRISALSSGLSTKNAKIRDKIISTIEYWLNKAINNKDIDAEPYWSLMIEALQNGRESIREKAATVLVEAKRAEVLPYVYEEWLKSYDTSKQEKACSAIARLKPAEGTEKLLHRIMEDPTESAQVVLLTQTIQDLNQYDAALANSFLSLCEGLGQKRRGSKEAFSLLLYFSGYQESADTYSNHVYRPQLFSQLLHILVRLSLFTKLEELLDCLAAHPIQESLPLDEVLSQLACIRYRKETTHGVRMRALKLSGERYEHFTPGLDDEAEEATYEGWRHLQYSLEINLNFHPVKERFGKEVSAFQYHSALSMVRCKGYRQFAFNKLKQVLQGLGAEDSLRWKQDAFDVLAKTLSLDILNVLYSYIGLNPMTGEQIPVTVHSSLFHRAIALIGQYLFHSQGEMIFKHLLRLAKLSDVRTLSLESLRFFTGHTDLQVDFVSEMLEIKNTTNPIYVEILIELHKALAPRASSEPKLATMLGDLQEVLLSKIFMVSIDEIYAHSLSFRAADDIELDRKVYQHAYLGLLSSDNIEHLRTRLLRNGDSAAHTQFLR